MEKSRLFRCNGYKIPSVATKFDNRGYFLDLILQIVAFIRIPNKTIKSFY